MADTRNAMLGFAADRKAFDEMLERVEAAQYNESTYGMVENQADVAIADRFVNRWWELLTNAEQTAYRSRLAYLKALGKGIR